MFATIYHNDHTYAYKAERWHMYTYIHIEGRKSVQLEVYMGEVDQNEMVHWGGRSDGN
jgi:hypothetical protein